MKTSCLICWIVTVVVLLSHPGWTEQSHGGHEKKENMMEWGGISNRVRGIKQRDVYPFNLWELYKNSSTFQKPKVVKEIQDAVTKLAYLDSRIDILGLILFGPKNRQSIIRAVRDEKRQMVDDQKCLKSTLKLFEKHCGLLTDHDMKQSLANICNYIVEKAAIKEAIILACGMRDTEPHAIGIDVADPKIDVTPAPVRGRFEYCGRVVVNGVLRRQLGSYAKAYQIMVVPSKKQIHDRWHNMIQICFHQNHSQGLCQCEEDDWRFVQKGSWSSVMSPFEQRFVDVKFVAALEGGFVTVTLHEVSQKWRYGLLVGGIALLLKVMIKDIFYEDADRIALFVKWAKHVLAVTCIFMSSSDTPLAVAAVCSCLVLCYMIKSIIYFYFKFYISFGGIARRLSKKTTLWPRSGLGQGMADTFGDEGYYSTFHKIRNRKQFSKKECEKLTRRSVSELVSSPEFEDWVNKNVHRIKFHVNNNNNGLDG
ncbi:hypothetical protein M8C21_018676 [Ambrosia artemisiifolia]|uniref:Legumain prodomain domain-containing protein n=1 Tax=Ambrosia artemisiifolia TaxID=4212 RepID=A0AAD5C1J1_AMBAR|nr:hypothetical protein M8C21_018676 [Ambrosia artemisiifolia]